MNIALNGMVLISSPPTGVEKATLHITKYLAIYVDKQNSHLNSINSGSLKTPHTIYFFSPNTASYTDTFLSCLSGLNNKKSFVNKKIKLFFGNRAERIIYEHSFFPYDILSLKCECVLCPAYILPRHISIDSVLIVHDCFALTNPEWCRLSNVLYYKTFFPYSVKRASAIIVPSMYVKRELIRLFPECEHKIYIVHFAVPDYIQRITDTEKLRLIKNRYNLPEKYILFVGNVEPRKNLKLILKVIRQLKDEGKLKHSLVITGGKQWKENVKQSVKMLNLNRDVVITGYVPDDDISALYSLADMLVYPSLSEGFGFPLLEAMKCQTPIITSDRGAIPEIAGDSALFVDPAVPDDLADAIYRLSESSEMKKKLIENGKREVQRFSWETTAKKIFDACSKKNNAVKPHSAKC